MAYATCIYIIYAHALIFIFIIYILSVFHILVVIIKSIVSLIIFQAPVHPDKLILKIFSINFHRI